MAWGECKIQLLELSHLDGRTVELLEEFNGHVGARAVGGQVEGGGVQGEGGVEVLEQGLHLGAGGWRGGARTEVVLRPVQNWLQPLSSGWESEVQGWS